MKLKKKEEKRHPEKWNLVTEMFTLRKYTAHRHTNCVSAEYMICDKVVLRRRVGFVESATHPALNSSYGGNWNLLELP